MNIRSVLIETKDPHSFNIQSTSAILIEEKYVLLTSYLLQNFFQENEDLIGNIKPGKLYFYVKKPLKFHVLWNNEKEIFKTETASLYAIFKCKNLNDFCTNGFNDWSAVANNNNVNIKKYISVFLILTIDKRDTNQDNLISILHTWLINISSIKVGKCDKIFCVSTPFGSRDFLNSYTEGIVSTQLKGSSLFLSDCTCAPGCEGGAVYIKGSTNFPMGIIISAFNWWRQDWVGFTFIADIRPILGQIILSCEKFSFETTVISKLLGNFENCLAQVNCGVHRGTCILISKEKGIFLTNSHVIKDNLAISLHWKDKMATADLIYKTPKDSVFDIAVIKSNGFIQSMILPGLNPSPCKIGESVYCAGYPLFSTFTRPEGITVTHGVISAYKNYMLKTTCGVYPGFSGGAVFNLTGNILGIIVSNTRLSENGVTYPKFNMVIPFAAVSHIIFEYLSTNDN